MTVRSQEGMNHDSQESEKRASGLLGHKKECIRKVRSEEGMNQNSQESGVNAL